MHSFGPEKASGFLTRTLKYPGLSLRLLDVQEMWLEAYGIKLLTIREEEMVVKLGESTDVPSKLFSIAV